jgi:N-acyl-phosphatidylethanolamine-hydrolysing phospholipase D
MHSPSPPDVTAPTHHDPRGGFRNPWPDSAPKGFAPLLRWIAERRTIRRPAPDPPASAFPLGTPRPGQARGSDLAATWIGHSTVLLELGPVRVLTDPIWSDFASPVPAPSLRRWVPAPLPLEALPALSVVLISHNHYDHLDAPTVRRLARLQPDAAWVTPLGNAPLLRRLGVRRVIELDWWETAEANGVTLGATPAQHFSARGVHDRNRALWSGFGVQAAGLRAFFAGDTGYHPEFGAIAGQFGPFDLSLLPVGAYEPRWFMRAMHMNPEDALAAYRDLGGGILIPIHWGTFKLTDEPMDEPPARTRRAWTEAGHRAEDLWLLRHGETRLRPAD